MRTYSASFELRIGETHNDILLAEERHQAAVAGDVERDRNGHRFTELLVLMHKGRCQDAKQASVDTHPIKATP